jgi:hypothetical protein
MMMQGLQAKDAKARPKKVGDGGQKHEAVAKRERDKQ